MRNKMIGMSIVLLGLSATSMAQATATATATATIVTPISITKTTDMNFGNVAVQTATGGTVILAPAGTRTTGGAGGVTLPATTGTVTAALFTVNGTGTYTFAITIPSTDLTLTGTPSGTMIVNAFTTPSPTSALVAGTKTFTVGATLNVSAAQAAGVYVSATGFDVTVNYN